MPLLSEPPTGAGVMREFDLDSRDPYRVLGVSNSASWAEIVAAHRSLARRFHPDRAGLALAGGEPALVSTDEAMAIINGAYRELRVRRGK